jgi:hypothetical protein
MTNYQLKPRQTAPKQPWIEAAEKRKKQLAEVRRRRRTIYQLMRKMVKS